MRGRGGERPRRNMLFFSPARENIQSVGPKVDTENALFPRTAAAARRAAASPWSRAPRRRRAARSCPRAARGSRRTPVRLSGTHFGARKTRTGREAKNRGILVFLVRLFPMFFFSFSIFFDKIPGEDDREPSRTRNELMNDEREHTFFSLFSTRILLRTRKTNYGSNFLDMRPF